MATEIYTYSELTFLDDVTVELSPLKIYYLRRFMDIFLQLPFIAEDDIAVVSALSECALIAMKQYRPEIKTLEQLEDVTDLNMLYDIVEAASGVDLRNPSLSNEEKEVKENKGSTWNDLDLAKIEAEVFTLGIWKNFEELEKSISMPEITALLTIKRELEYDDKKFMAAMQGVDIDKNSDSGNAWEELKARVASKGMAANSKDILALQGVAAKQAGFGIGMGLDYESHL